MTTPHEDPHGPGPTLSTVTSTTLLEGLADHGNRTVWLTFVERYRPTLVRSGERAGLPREDAEDVAQQSLIAFTEAYRNRKYERSRGRLRDWLFGIVSNQIKNWRRAGGRRAARLPETRREVGDVPTPDDLERIWDEEWRDAVARECLAQVRREVRESTFEAFRRTALLGEPADRVADALGLSVNAVYGAKRRVLRRVRELVPLVEDAW